MNKTIAEYHAKVTPALDKTLDIIGEEIKDRQEQILSWKVKNGTGRLESSIEINRTADSVQVGPTVDYAIYVEEGTRYFDGYHFVSGSMEGIQTKYENLVKQALKR